MLTRTSKLPAFFTLCAILALSTNIILAQSSAAEFQELLRGRLAFEEIDIAALQQGQTIVKLLPVQDKREVAVSGLVRLQVSADVFLQSFRESMVRKSNPAILEIGSFSSRPTLDDLNGLTIENRDIEDLKRCVVGDCRLKLSATMIQRFQEEVDWEAADHRNQATQLLKVMLLDYVRGYLARGDAALMEYRDKAKTVRLAEEQSELKANSSYIYDLLTESSQSLKTRPRPVLADVENAIVWSKMKFGLKPVIAINHITIYKSDNDGAQQILIASKQIYANHYFDSSLALTAFVNIPGESNGSYLFYENRSRADGLDGVFGGLKRGIVEGKALDSLRAILEQSKASLNARSLSQPEFASVAEAGRSWRRWKVGRIHLFMGVFIVLAFVSSLALINYDWKRVVTREAHD